MDRGIAAGMAGTPSRTHAAVRARAKRNDRQSRAPGLAVVRARISYAAPARRIADYTPIREVRRVRMLHRPRTLACPFRVCTRYRNTCARMTTQ